MAVQIGRGMRITSTKQDVGIGEEMVDEVPFSQSAFSPFQHMCRKTHEAFATVTAKLHCQIGCQEGASARARLKDIQVE